MLEVHAPHESIHTWKDFAIHIATIVIGLLIAVGLEQTVEYFHHQHQAAEFEEHLRADLREEEWGYELLIDYNQQVLTNAERAAGALEGKATLTDEALLVSAYRATQYRNRRQRRATFDELVSTGTIGMIRDQQLRNTAMQLYNSPAMDDLVAEGRRSHFRETFRMSIPNDVQRTLNTQCGDRRIEPGNLASIHGSLDFPCATGLPAQVVADAVKSLRANPEVLGGLRLRIADLESRLVDLTRNNSDLWERLRLLAKPAP